MSEANSINASTTGIVGNTGTGFTGTAVTNHRVLVGGATSSTLTNLAAGSTGQVLQSAGSSADPAYSTATYPATAGTSGKVLISDGTNIVSSTPTFPNASATSRKITVSDGTNWVASTETWAVPGTSGNFLQSNGTNWLSNTTLGIANGGSNATSFTQSNGIVTYNGTSLVNYAGPQLSSGGVYTNTTQPGFFAYLNSATSNSTGDGTQFTVVFDTIYNSFNVGSMYSTSTGVCTIAVAGVYVISANIEGYNFGTLHGQAEVWLTLGGGFRPAGTYRNPAVVSPSTTGSFIVTCTLPLVVNDVLSIIFYVDGSTKTVGVNSGIFVQPGSYFSVIKVA